MIISCEIQSAVALTLRTVLNVQWLPAEFLEAVIGC